MTSIEELEEKSVESQYTPDDEYHLGYSDGIREAIRVIKAHSDWIPSSQPPKTDDEILISVIDLEDDDYRFVCKGNYYPEKHYWSSSELYGGCNIEAWQPLPEPYEGE